MQSIIAGVDVGFGRLKALTADRKLEYPSVVGPWREIRYRSELNNGSFLEQMAVEYAGQKLFIGEAAYRQSKARVNMSPERFCSTEGMALLLSALAALAPGREAAFNLVTGLPVNAFAAQNEWYRQVLAGRHYIKLLCPDGSREERRITIAEVKVVPQPMGCSFRQTGCQGLEQAWPGRGVQARNIQQYPRLPPAGPKGLVEMNAKPAVVSFKLFPGKDDDLIEFLRSLGSREKSSYIRQYFIAGANTPSYRYHAMHLIYKHIPIQ